METRTTTCTFCVFGLLAALLFSASPLTAEQRAERSLIRLPRGMLRPTENIVWKYLVHLPSNYSTGSQKGWPMILYLHGKGVRGNDWETNLSPVKRYGIPAFLDRKPDFPFVVISPQLPEESWPEQSLLKLLDEVTAKYNVDRDRIYLTGVDIGAAGVWNLAAADQRRFAAIAPLCGTGDPDSAEKLNDLPVWAFHGDADKVEPLGRHQRLVDAVNQNNGKAKMTVIPGGTHGDIIYPTYQRQDLYDWFLSHDRSVKPIVKPIVAEPVKPAPEAEAKPVIPQPRKKTHIVKKGETLWRISKFYEVNLDALKKVNGLKSNVIGIDQILVIPTE